MSKRNVSKSKSRRSKIQRRPGPWCGKNMPTLPALIENHADDRGYLKVFFSDARFKSKAGSVAVISAKAGSERANHYHRKDSHLCFVVSGEIHYYERKCSKDGSEPIHHLVVSAGASFFTPPMVEHTMFFPEDTVFVTVGNKNRTHAQYENDIRRVASLKAKYEAANPAPLNGSEALGGSGHGI